jgi:AAA domain-containing protein
MKTAQEHEQAAREAREQAGVGNNDSQETEKPYVLTGGSPLDYLNAGLHDEDILIGDGWLERRGFFFVVAQSGIGKSQALLQICCCWSCGQGGQYAFYLDPFGGRPLRIIIIQNEDSRNDIYRQSCLLNALGFNKDQISLIHKNLWIETVRGKLGPAAIDTFKKIIELRNGCDLLILNPLSAYVKGDLTSTEDASEFLYGHVSPLLDQYDCGGGAAHHTPKSTGVVQKSKNKWSSWDFMYSGAGAATLTNFSRGYITIDPKGDSRVFDIRIAKRIELSGWNCGLEMFRWEQRGDARLWVPASKAEAQKAQTSAQKTIEDLRKLVPASGETIPKSVLEFQACKVAGFTQQEYRAALDQALDEFTPDDLRLYEWKRYNPHGASPVTIGRFPQPEHEKPHVIKAAQKAERERQRAAQMEAKRQAKIIQMSSH